MVTLKKAVKDISFYKSMNAAQIAVLVSTWKWRILKAGYKNSKDFCDSNNIQESHFSAWVSGKQRPMPKNVKKVEDILEEAGV